MGECHWCEVSARVIGNKTTVTREDYRYAPTFIEDPDIGPRELRAATALRRWVHDLRWANLGIVACAHGDSLDAMLSSPLEVI